MAMNPLRETLNHLRQILPSSGEDALSDSQLLTRFVATRDESAFAALVRRHGPMVLGICRQVLRHAQDAEDAFQASFLVLARKAASITHRQTVASWLYRVSYRVALEAKAVNDRRRAREKQVEDVPHPRTMPAEIQDWRPRLDHELNRLPEKYRTPVLLCDLEGRSRREAARQLGVPEGTVSSRLATARRLLAKRLSRYGAVLSGGALAAVMSEVAASAVPAPLASAAVRAASGQGEVSASVAFLMKGALKVMFLAKMKLAVGAVMVGMALGATGLFYRASGQDTSAPAGKGGEGASGQPKPAPAEKRDGGKPPTELEILRQEVELLKRKLEVVQEKLRAQENELRALRAAAGKSAQPEGERVRGRPATTRPDIALDAGNLQWPQALQGETFKDGRNDFRRHLKQAFNSVQVNSSPDESTLSDLQVDLKRLQTALDDGMESLAPDRYIEAKRYLKRLVEVITALRKFDGKESKQRAMEALEKAMKKLREPKGELRRER